MEILIALLLSSAVSNVEGTLVTLTTEGEVRTKPDLAIISLGVTTESASASAALSENTKRMNALREVLERAGVAERDIQTTSLSILPQQVYAEGKPPRISGYQAQNLVTAKVRDIASLGRTIDAAIKAGGNSLHGVEFALADPERALDLARRAAVKRLQERAQIYASSSGLRVHRIVSITEGAMSPTPPTMMMMHRTAEVADATPIAPGELQTSTTVTMVYELR